MNKIFNEKIEVGDLSKFVMFKWFVFVMWNRENLLLGDLVW